MWGVAREGKAALYDGPFTLHPVAHSYSPACLLSLESEALALEHDRKRGQKRSGKRANERQKDERMSCGQETPFLLPLYPPRFPIDALLLDIGCLSIACNTPVLHPDPRE